jgi:L-seryl-tRNA(Ser) seleniumtransferase
VVTALQEAVDESRRAILQGAVQDRIDTADVLARAERRLARRSTASLRTVLNATGIVLHTGLGRAPLSAAAVSALAQGASGYCNLELDLESGARGRRGEHVAARLAELTGAEAATVVNNNAAATLLILNTLAAGREVVVSRGQLVEIGGSFRLPNIMAAGGALLREVGTTNRTRLADYENALNDRTALWMRVHTSNYRVVGFTQEASLPELADLARRTGLPLLDDLGSGALWDFREFDLPAEPMVKDSIAAGADLVCFSGDKLLGGPQCGLIVGRRALVAQLEQNPLMRTYRVDKLVLLALEATLRAYGDAVDPAAEIPTLAMLRQSAELLAERAGRLAEQLTANVAGERFYVCTDVGFAGGGSLPAEQIPTVVVQWRPSRASVAVTLARLRQAPTPVVARARDDSICFDLRTLADAEFDRLVAAVMESSVEPHDDEP